MSQRPLNAGSASITGFSTSHIGQLAAGNVGVPASAAAPTQ
ncbi:MULTISPECIES: hypothetical protein [Paenarthrobacter]|nr:hypothetical protein [Paenarthrobacter nitroguajacolicus]